jgi:hypothetical protein
VALAIRRNKCSNHALKLTMLSLLTSCDLTKAGGTPLLIGAHMVKKGAVPACPSRKESVNGWRIDERHKYSGASMAQNV